MADSANNLVSPAATSEYRSGADDGRCPWPGDSDDGPLVGRRALCRGNVGRPDQLDAEFVAGGVDFDLSRGR